MTSTSPTSSSHLHDSKQLSSTDPSLDVRLSGLTIGTKAHLAIPQTSPEPFINDDTFIVPFCSRMSPTCCGVEIPPVNNTPASFISHCSSSAATKTIKGSSSLVKRRLPPPINTDALLAMSAYPIHSSYIVKEKIGQGTWGSVHYAIERTSGLERAVKKVPKRFTPELARFRQEITLLKGLDHPNVVRLYETFEDYANIYMVMEYCRGGELFERVIHSKYFSEATAARFMHQILSSVSYIHRKNIAHRDLKPENFLFVSTDEFSPMKLIDFGLAKRFNSRRRMRTKVGTLCYVSPEVLAGNYNEKCDIWSAGVIMYLLLSGTPIFNGPTDAIIINQIRTGEVKLQESIWKSISPFAKDLLRLLVHKDPLKRPSAHEALRHNWFDLFSPSVLSRLAFPRPISMPILQSISILSQAVGGSSEDTYCPEPTSTYCLPSYVANLEDPNHQVACCELSILGVHSPLCLKSSPGRASLMTVPQPAGNLGEIDPMQRQLLTPSIAQPISEILQAFPRSTSMHASSSVTSLEQWSAADKTIDSIEVFSNLARNLVPKWKRFALHNQLRRAALRVVAQQLSDGDQLKDLRSLFLTLDSKHDGALTADEVASGVRLLKSASSRNFLSEFGSNSSTIETSDFPDPQQPRFFYKQSSIPEAMETTGLDRSMPPYFANNICFESTPYCRQYQSFPGLHSLPLRECQTSGIDLTGASTPLVDPSFSSFSQSPATARSSPDLPSTSQSITQCISTRSLVNRSEYTDPDDTTDNELMNIDQMKSLVNEVALNGGDIIEYSDFIAATMDKSHYNDDNVLRAAFRVFDRDGDGRITVNELRSALGWLDPMTMPVDTEPPLFYGTHANNQPLRRTVDDEVRNILRVCSTHRDGSIHYEDFARVVLTDSDLDQQETPSSADELQII